MSDDQQRLANSRYAQTIRRYGRPAGAADSAAVAALVKRYSAAAIAHDGAAACRLIYSPLAESVAEDYGQPPGPAYARGKTCAVVMSKLFRHTQDRLPAVPRMVMVRVKGNQGYAVSSYRHAGASYALVRRERGRWKLAMLMISRLP